MISFHCIIYIVHLVLYTLPVISCSTAVIFPSEQNDATSYRLRGGTAPTTTTVADEDRMLQQRSKVGKVIRLRVMSANNDNENGARLIDPLNNGTKIEIGKFPANQFFNIEAVSSTDTGPIGSIGFTLKRGSGTGSVLEDRGENTAPFSLCGDNHGFYLPCQIIAPSILRYTITATPYELRNLKGVPGVTRTITFTVIGGNSPPPAVPVARPVQPPVQRPVTPPTFASAVWIEVDNDAPLNKRHEACFLMVGRKAYLLAGRNINPVNIYDPIARKWTNGKPPPISIHHAQCVAVDTSIWIVSSWTGGYPRETNNELIYIYDTIEDSWSTKPGLPEERRRGSTAAVLMGRRIYVSHGNRGGHETGNHATTYGWLDYYDIDKERWVTNLPDAPNPRDHAGGGVVDGRICIAGGRDGGAVDFFYKPILPTDCYDPEKNKWYVEASIPEGRSGSSYGTTCDGKLMVAGGEGGSKASKKEAWANVDVFDGKSWVSIDGMNIARHGSGLAVDCICKQIHIAGGAATQGGRNEITSVETLFPKEIDSPCRA